MDTVASVAVGGEEHLAAAFRSVRREYRREALPVDGRFPEWLRGALLRNGPGAFDGPGWQARHLFDGTALLQRFAFDDDGGVRWTSRFLRSPLRRAVASGGRARWRQFGTPTSRTPIDIVRALISPPYPDNAVVNFAHAAGRTLALTETPYAVEIDPETLATRGRAEWGDERGELFLQTCTAHPVSDPRSGDLVNVGTKFAGRERWYRAWRWRGGTRVPFATLRVGDPAYLHSFAMTESALVLAEFPLVLAPLRLLLGEDSYIRSFRWRPALGTRVRVVSSSDGRTIADAQAPACFAFHHVNAYDDGGEVVCDVCAYDDHRVIDAYYLDRLAMPGASLPAGRWRRWRIDPARGTVREERPFAEAFEFASVAPSRAGRRARWAYAVGSRDDTPDGGYDRLLKLDLDRGSACAWRADGFGCGEPVFVPRPGGTAEDDGVVLALLHARAGERDALVVLDAATWSERARAWLPAHVPFGFHGCWMQQR